MNKYAWFSYFLKILNLLVTAWAQKNTQKIKMEAQKNNYVPIKVP